jgi:hypothetical protein
MRAASAEREQGLLSWILILCILMNYVISIAAFPIPAAIYMFK